MAEIEEAVFEGLKGDAAIFALVGINVFPFVVPQSHDYSKGGAITYSRIVGSKVHSQGRDSGLAFPRIQITAWARTYIVARNISTKIRLFLQDFTGDLGTTGVIVEGVILEDDGVENYDDKVKVYNRAADYLIWHREARTT